jgi:hypothetical protein
MDVLPSRSRSRRSTAPVAVALLLVFLGGDIYLWRATHGFPAMLDQSETTIKFLAGYNFARFGIVRQWFTPDFATGADAAAHPMYYTHYADFTDHFAYLLIKLGVATIPGQILVGVFVTALGLYVMYLAVAVYLNNSRAALCVLLVSVIDYTSVWAAGLNTHKNWAWLVVFAPVWAFKRYADSTKRGFLWCAVVAYFLLAYYDYGLMVYVALVLILLKRFGFYHRCSWKDLATPIVAGGVTACLVHAMLVMAAVGPAVFWADARLTLLNRVAGSVPRRDLVQFYQSNGIVLWGYDDPGTMGRNLGTTITRMIELFGGVVCWLVALTVVLAFLGVCTARTRIVGRLPVAITAEVLNIARFVAAWALPVILMFPVFHIQMTVLYASAWAPLYVFPFAIASGMALFVFSKSVVAALDNGPLLACVGAAAWVITIPLAILTTQYRHVTGDIPIREFPGYEVLARYRGRSFVTNYQAAYISYFTHEWAAYHGMAVIRDSHFPPIDDYSRSYVFERDVVTNPHKYDRPEFAFLMWSDHPALAKNFPLVERGPNYWIYDVRDRAGTGEGPTR